MSSLELRGRLGIGLGSRGRPKNPGPPPFSPASIPGLAFWYDAGQSQQVAPGGTVQRWADLSGNGNDAEQDTAAARPVPVTDGAGRAALSFDGVDDVLTVMTPPDLSAGLTVFVVFRVRERVDFAGLLAAGAASGADHQSFFTLQNATAASLDLQLYGRSQEADDLVIKAVDSGGIQYALFTVDAASASLRDANGERTDGTTSLAFGTPAAMALGARLNDGSPFGFAAMDLFEVGLYPRVLDPAELDQLEDHLKAKRGLRWSPAFFGADLAWLHDAEDSPRVESGGAVDRWDDLSVAGRHFAQTGTARPIPAIDPLGRQVIRFDGVDDVMAMTGPLPALDPFSTAVICRVRARDDFAGILSAAPTSGPDVTEFWSLRLTTAEGDEVQLRGRDSEPDPLDLARPESAAAQVLIWTTAAGSGSLRDASGEVTDTFDGGFGLPEEIVLGGRFDGAPLGHAAIDVLATLGVGRVLTADEQARVIDWASRKWGI